MTGKTLDLVKSITTGKTSDVRTKLNEVLSDKASEVLEFRKVSVAKALFGKKD